jgi:hypothetical protein
MGKELFLIYLLLLVLDYAENGEILKWNSKTCKFRPFKENHEHMTESEIKKLLRHCIRGLHYSNQTLMFLKFSAYKQHRT